LTDKRFDSTLKEKHKVRGHTRRTPTHVTYVREYLRRSRGIGGGWTTRNNKKTINIEGGRFDVTVEDRIAALRGKIKDAYGDIEVNMIPVHPAERSWVTEFEVVVKNLPPGSMHNESVSAKTVDNIDYYVHDTFSEGGRDWGTDTELSCKTNLTGTELYIGYRVTNDWGD
jgi:hypothetical protein